MLAAARDVVVELVEGPLDLLLESGELLREVFRVVEDDSRPPPNPIRLFREPLSFARFAHRTNFTAKVGVASHTLQLT